ncbi:MAG: enoyl-CoA hydratase [Actinomycetota bacterium]|nr:enoyl-CoA hydratase [Actinomycetota bacterium]
MAGRVSTESAYQTLTVERRGHVAEVTLSRPEVLNTFDERLHAEFTVAFDELGQDPGVRAIVLASTGRVFSAGGDFEMILSLHSEPATRAEAVERGRRLLRTLMDIPQPVVAAVQGDVIGLGATVVLACDAVVMAGAARIGDPHVVIGLVAADGGCLVWPAAAGMVRARRYLLSGELVPADEARAMGLVTDLVPDAEGVLPAARALAERFAALPPLAVQATKRVLNQVTQERCAEVLDLGFAHQLSVLASDDLVEAVAAVRERRPGKYTGI